MSYIRNYKKSTWKNQTIRGKPVNFVKVRIYQKANIITSNGTETLIAADAPAIRKTPQGYLYIYNHSFAVFSKESKSIYTIKVCLANNFDITKLETVNFPEKPYVMEALGNVWLI